MLILLSPSKTINFKPLPKTVVTTKPQFLTKSQELVTAVQNLGPKLANIFGVSEKIAEENDKQFKMWSQNPKDTNSCPAAFAYRGETYAGLSIEELDTNALQFAQEHLYTISGLYGLLRPLDRITPYRLEVGTKLKGPWGADVYAFWGKTLAQFIEKQPPDFILNCASNEYYSIIGKYLSKDIPIFTPKFFHNGKQKMAFAKYTRGLMAKWAIENRITEPRDILKFNAEGYTYDPQKSTEAEPAFNAPQNFSLAGRWKKT